MIIMIVQVAELFRSLHPVPDVVRAHAQQVISIVAKSLSAANAAVGNSPEQQQLSGPLGEHRTSLMAKARVRFGDAVAAAPSTSSRGGVAAAAGTSASASALATLPRRGGNGGTSVNASAVAFTRFVGKAAVTVPAASSEHLRRAVEAYAAAAVGIAVSTAVASSRTTQESSASKAKAKAKAKATPKRTGKRGKAKRGRGNTKAAVDQDTQPLPNAKRPRWTAALAPTSAAPVRFAAQRGAVLEKLREHTLARCILDGGMMVVGGGVEEEVEGDL